MRRILLGVLLAAEGGLARLAAAQAPPSAPPAIEQPVPLATVRVEAPALKRRILGNSSDARRPFFWPDYTTPGNQVGQRITLKQAGWLEAVSFRVVACSYDSLFLRVQVYAVAQDFPGAPLLPPTVAVRLARADLANRVVLDLRPYHVWLAADAVVALELLRPQGPGTLAFSATRMPGTLYKIDLPGDGTHRNIPPRNTRVTGLPWQQSPTSAWRKTTLFGVNFTATVLQESR